VGKKVKIDKKILENRPAAAADRNKCKNGGDKRKGSHLWQRTPIVESFLIVP